MKSVKGRERILTKVPMAWTGLRIPRAEMDLWLAASAKRGVSRAEFVREALREKAIRTLSESAQ
jgi:hypothetical protein